MSKTIIAQLIIICLAHDGYRRAGVEFDKGENILDASELSDAQLGQIKADSRLEVVESKTPATKTNPGKNTQGSLDENGVVLTPKLTPEQQFSAIVATLDKGNKKHFTNDGKPQLDALKAAGLKLLSAERDAAWAAYLDVNAKVEGNDNGETE